MKTHHLVTAMHRGKIYYRENAGGWTIHREGAKRFPTAQLAQRERDAHWAHDVQHETRTESTRATL